MGNEQTRTRVEVYSTKLHHWTKRAIVAFKSAGRFDSERELLEEMVRTYAAANPEVVERARGLMAIMGEEFPAEVTAGRPAVVEHKEASAGDVQPLGTRTGRIYSDKPSVERIVNTVKYVGKEAVHVYDPERKNETGCGLAGVIDPATIEVGPASTVTCGKCRYSRKDVLGL